MQKLRSLFLRFVMLKTLRIISLLIVLFRKSSHNRPNSSTSAGEADDANKPGESIMVRVICPSSRVLVFKTDVNKRLNELKSEVILELSDDPESIQLFAPDVRHLNPRYRLYRAEYFGGELNEGDTLAQLKVRNNETFILSPRRNTLPQTVSRIREVPGPNEQLVESATRYVPVNCNQLPTIDINEIFQQSNVSATFFTPFNLVNRTLFLDTIRCAEGAHIASTGLGGGDRSGSLCTATDSHAEATFD